MTSLSASPFFPAFAIKFSSVVNQLKDPYRPYTHPLKIVNHSLIIQVRFHSLHKIISRDYITEKLFDGRFYSLLLASENTLKYEGLGTQFVLNNMRVLIKQFFGKYSGILKVNLFQSILYFKPITRPKKYNWRGDYYGYLGKLNY